MVGAVVRFPVRPRMIWTSVARTAGPLAKKWGVCVCFITAGPITKLCAWGGFFCEGLMNVLHVRFEKFVFEEKPANWIEKIEILAISEFEGHSVCVCVFLCFM
jgi:hypothetical protein